MKNPHLVILKPLVTEKGTTLKDEHNQVLFEVASDATKAEIRFAVQRIFKVRVTSVNTVVVRGKRKRMGRLKNPGHRSNWKKAFVTLHKGDNIEFVEAQA